MCLLDRRGRAFVVMLIRRVFRPHQVYVNERWTVPETISHNYVVVGDEENKGRMLIKHARSVSPGTGVLVVANDHARINDFVGWLKLHSVRADALHHFCFS
jgi:superfamily II DNA/RNA helicase